MHFIPPEGTNTCIGIVWRPLIFHNKKQMKMEKVMMFMQKKEKLVSETKRLKLENLWQHGLSQHCA